MNGSQGMRLIFPLFIFLFILFFLWRGLMQDLHVIPSPLIDKTFPHFQLTLLSNDAQQIDQDIFKGHLSILNVFATWCVSCQAEHAVFMELADSAHVPMYGLNYKDSRGNTLTWLKKYGNPYKKVIYDPQGKLGLDLGVYGTPETYIIDAHGVIRYKYIGPISPSAWRDKLMPIISRLKAL